MHARVLTHTYALTHAHMHARAQMVVEKAIIMGLATGNRRASGALAELVTTYASILAAQARGRARHWACGCLVTIHHASATMRACPAGPWQARARQVFGRVYLGLAGVGAQGCSAGWPLVGRCAQHRGAYARLRLMCLALSCM